jgi:hypothetical protein
MMTPEQAKSSIGKNVYGLGFDEKAIEEYKVIAYNEGAKTGSGAFLTLQPERGDAFNTGIADYFVDEHDALLLASSAIEDMIESSEKEIESLKADIARYHANLIQVKRRIQKIEHSMKIRAGIAKKKSA